MATCPCGVALEGRRRKCDPCKATGGNSSRTRQTKSTTPLQDAAKDGARRKVLEALRLRVAEELDDAGLSPRDLASLSKRLMELQDQIDALLAKEGGGVQPDSGAQPGGDGGLADAASTPDEPFPSA